MELVLDADGWPTSRHYSPEDLFIQRTPTGSQVVTRRARDAQHVIFTALAVKYACGMTCVNLAVDDHVDLALAELLFAAHEAEEA